NGGHTMAVNRYALAAALMTVGCSRATPNVKTSTSARADGPTCTRIRPGVGARRVDGPRQGSTVALAEHGGALLAYVADEDMRAIHTVNADTGRSLAVTSVAGAPSQLIVLEDGRVAVTLRDANRVAVLEPAGDADQPLALRCSVPVATEPVAL